MDNKHLFNKFKTGISTQQLEDFAHKHTPEVFAVCAIVIASISSLFDFFTGSSWAVLFFAIGTIAGVVFPSVIESKLSKIYRLIGYQDKTTEMIIGGMKIIVALFLPFIYFCFLGLFAGTSYYQHFRHLSDR
jgi:cytochrome bd-type quinol oxidase subunit 2